MMVIYSAQEFIACAPEDEEGVKAVFFRTHQLSEFTRTIVGDFAYVRAVATKHKVSAGTPGGVMYGTPTLAITTNLFGTKL